MKIDLKSKEQKNKFIEENLSNNLESINETYGPILVQELMARLRFTIDEIKIRMTKDNCLVVPLEIDIGHGNNWDEAH